MREDRAFKKVVLNFVAEATKVHLSAKKDSDGRQHDGSRCQPEKRGYVWS